MAWLWCGCGLVVMWLWFDIPYRVKNFLNMLLVYAVNYIRDNHYLRLAWLHNSIILNVNGNSARLTRSIYIAYFRTVFILTFAILLYVGFHNSLRLLKRNLYLIHAISSVLSREYCMEVFIQSAGICCSHSYSWHDRCPSEEISELASIYFLLWCWTVLLLDSLIQKLT